MSDEKLKVLVLGGCGFIGRHIVSELVEDENVEKVCIVDKVPPQIAWLNVYHTTTFSNKKVSFKSANLINPGSCESSFGDTEWDWVINAAGETKSGQVDAVFKEGIQKLSINCAKNAAARGAKVYIEISSGQMGASEKIPNKEDSTCNPWTLTAKYKLLAEEEIKSIPNLNWIILRLPIVYGPGDRQGITPRLVIGAVYHHLGEIMKLLWDENLKINTVHVTDVSRAVVWLSKRGKTGQIYNVVDECNTTQGYITNIISNIFNINHEYIGNILSTVAKTDIEGLISEINEKHLAPWAALCSVGGVDNTPLSPYLHQEAIMKEHLHLDGSKLRKEGFKYNVPKPSQEKLMELFIDEGSSLSHATLLKSKII
ncbi:dTDP-D-glucose 4,6-dehydratase isoform X2 [Oratosquilla oratoria]|uniref:dTDP-D-glucose 4,6-dehydratase isoform X2 n=1 Tax=Oratosquilla oratoria TaxID=337810 RepID=UPI003F75AE21